MPNWDSRYYGSLVERVSEIVDGLDDRLDSVIDGRIAPAVENLVIGSARRLRVAAFFFDIRGFSSRTGSGRLDETKRALLMLDVVIPMVMHIVYDYGGYVEKNTGDGVMAIIGSEAVRSDSDAANAALDIATISFYLLNNLVNPYLTSKGIDAVDARIGIDLGTLLLARIGTPKGSAQQDRSFLTAVGSAANLAAHLQQMAGTNQIWVGDLIRQNAAEWRQQGVLYRDPPVCLVFCRRWARKWLS
jgi:class 3 adenylate cyclase